MAQRTLSSYQSPSKSSSSGPSPHSPQGPTNYFSPGYEPTEKDEFRHLVWQTYKETYQDEGPHPHPIFTKLRINRPKHVAMQIYAGLMNGHSLTECVATAGIDFARFEDRKWSNHPRIHSFEALVRSYIWGMLRGIEYRSHIVSELSDRPNTRRELGYGTFNGTRRCPHQTNFNEAWNDRFGPDLRSFITEVVAYVREWAYDNNRLIETTELLVPDERDETQELTKDQIRRIVNEMVGYITPNYSFNREGGVSHDKNVFFKLLAHCALTSSSVHGGGDTFEWQQIDDDDPPHGRTVLDLVKSLSAGEMLSMYADAIDGVVEALDKQVGLYDSPVPLAIDTTTIESDAKWKRVTISSIADPEYHEWSDRKKKDTYAYIEEEGIECLVGEDPEKIRTASFRNDEKREAAERISDVVRYVHGTKSGDDFKYAWEFGAAAIAHPSCPLIYAMEPLERKDELEDHVERFIERGQELVTVSEVYMDSAYSQVAVQQLFHYGNGFRTEDQFNIPYVMNIREEDSVKKAVLQEKPGRGDITTRMDENEGDISVVKNYRQHSQEHGYGATTLVGLPKRDYENGGVVDVEDPVTDRVAFSTSRTDIDAENAIELLRGPDSESFSDPVRKRKAKHERGYTNRWLIEIGFEKTKDFLAFTKSGHGGVRLFYVLYASLLFDVWMTVDRAIKQEEYELGFDVETHDEDDSVVYATSPRISADVLSTIVANYLRPVT